MTYLSQLLNKNIYYKSTIYGKVVDFYMSEQLQTTTISKLIVKRDRQKIALPIRDIEYQDGTFFLKIDNPSFEPADGKGFYLVEDLLDKQVIDVTGRRLVRVNDIALQQKENILIIKGIDIGFSGILRRLGLPFALGLKTITIPWSLIEAFDYQTGDVKIKLAQSKLNTFHPAEIADILEEAGTKERLGVVEVLDARRAASSIAEADEETQQSILEELPKKQLEQIIKRMPVSEIADVLHDLNTDTVKQIFKFLGSEKAQKVRRLLVFADDVAGGLMSVSFYSQQETRTVEEVLTALKEKERSPEVIVVVDADGKLTGLMPLRKLLNQAKEVKIKDIMDEAKSVYEYASFQEILRLFSEYNLRILPVVNNLGVVIGVIPIDSIVAQIQEEEEYDEPI